MKTIKVILIVLAIVLLALTAFFYFVDAPIIEEGQEPTVAQKILLLGKQYLAELLALLGASALGVMAVLAKFIYNSSKNTQTVANTTSLEILQLKTENAELKNQFTRLYEITTNMGQKQDILTNALLTTLSLSELPTSVREKIYTAQTAYNALGTAKETIEEVIVATAKVPLDPIQQVSVFDTSNESQPEEPSEKSTSPIYV